MLRFTRLGSTTLYSSSGSADPGSDHGQLLFLLPKATPRPASSMTLSQTWTFQHATLGAGYYLFLEAGRSVPAGGALTAFADRIHALIPRVVRGQHSSLGWITGDPAVPASLRLQTLEFVRLASGRSYTVVTKSIPQKLLFQQIELTVNPGIPFTQATGETGFNIANPGAGGSSRTRTSSSRTPQQRTPREPTTPTAGNIFIAGASDQPIDKVGETLFVPLSGPGRGSLQFVLEGLAQTDIDPGFLDTAIYYVVPEPTAERDQSMRFPMLDLVSPSGPLGARLEIDLQAMLFPANHLDSRFSFANAAEHIMRTYFRTDNGDPVLVTPAVDAGFVFTHVPNPGVFRSRGASVQTFFSLTPVGNYELQLEQQPSDFGRLMGGQSGTEYFSFKPRQNGTPGDYLAFFAGQRGYAPDFSGVQTLQSDIDLLNGTYGTSWATVGSGNGHVPQYYAQPDDAALHEVGSFSNAVYLSFAEVAASALAEPSEISCFPLVPLAGVVAPDDRISPPIGADKYRILELEILNPIRKERISINSGPALASVSGRSLLQAGTRKTTTPQGMLAELDGTAWTALTLAYDGFEHLKFADITDEFQDALQSNRLFMVASKSGTLADAADYTENKVEITEWPFRIDVGNNPPAAPGQGTGLSRFNNVLIFKFVDQTFEELADDTRVWANPGAFNDNPPEVQTWLKEFIADAKTKAEDPETQDLYGPLVNNVLTRASWTGILALNVTVPMNEMPCAVQGLMGGIRKPAEFKAHHVGFEISKVLPDASAIEKSSIFALIDYEDNDPPTGGTPTPDYEFLVKTLKVRFANTEIADFNSKIALVIKKAFDERIKNPITIPGKITIDTLEMDGKYQVFNGVPTYTFELIAVNNPMEFEAATDKLSLIHQMTVTKIQFASTSCPDENADPASAQMVSKFSLWGDLNFRSNAAFDFFSFDKLVFSDLAITMTFGFNAEGVAQRPDPATGFSFEPGNLRFSISGSKSRTNSLMSNFPLRLNDFHYATGGLDVSQLGYLSIPNLVPGWDGATNPKYALAFTIDIGPLSSQSAKKKPKGAIEIIAAWGPSDESDGVTFGVKLGAGTDGNKEIGIEGVLTLSVDNFGFLKIPEIPADGEGYVYAFFIKSAFLKILNTQIPPGGDFSLMLFVPYTASDTVNLSNLGWFVAYNRDGGSGTGGAISAPIDVEIVSVTLDAPNNEVNPNTNVTIKVVVQVKSTAIRPPEKITISVEAEATGETTSRPSSPTPFRKDVTLAIGQSNAATPAEFTWTARMPGTYKFVAAATVPGDLTPGNNTKDSAVLTVKSSANTKKKRSIVHLDYLGIGHRVQISPGDTEQRLLTTVESVIDVMRNDFIPQQTGDKLQEQLAKLYNPEAGMLIGVDITLFQVVRLAFVFAEANEMYGALIGFVDKAPSFLKGFQFQILYKKITDDIGVYQMVLKLPDYLRQFELGAASITLPIIGIDIYTNGNFKLNFGFPVNANFANSFSIQMMAGPVPILGFAGFYFSYLSGATSTLVPVFKTDSTAKWDPVMEFGIGLSVGIGKTIEKGPLRAGVSVSIVVILEGALAWYQPPGGATVSTLGDPPDWYRVKGQAGLVAQLYGIVDFGIIKLGIEVNASATFLFVFESYKDTTLGVILSVSVRVSVVIGSFKIFGKRITIEISFSFSATFSFSFTIENTMGEPPWKNELPGAAATSFVRPLAALQQTELEAIEWVAAKTVAGTPGLLELTFAPQVTVAKDGGAQHAHAVAGLTIANGGSSAFNTLLTGLIEWTVDLHVASTSGLSADALTVASLEELDTRLHIPRTLATSENNPSPLDYAEIRAFLAANYSGVSLKPMQALADDEAVTMSSQSVFPMIPELKLVTNGQDGSQVSIDFGAHNPRNDAYQQDVADYFDELLVDVEHKSGIISATRALQQAGASVSMATIVLQDYFAFLIKSGVDRALESARKNAVGDEADPSVVSTISLSALLTQMTDDGDLDTISSMASRFFFHGLRLPPVFDGSTSVDLSERAEALYKLTGQQVPIKLTPAVLDEDGEVVTPSPDWTIGLELNTATNDLLELSTGGVTMTIATDDTESRDNVELLRTLTPALGGDVSVEQLPRLASRPRHFSFKNPTHLERPAGAKSASLYPLPDTLLDLLAERADAVDLKLYNEGDDVTSVAGLGTWALRINFTAKRVQRTVDGTGALLDNTYVIGGASEGTRNLIGALLETSAAGVTDMRLYFEVDGKTDALVGENLGSEPNVVLMKTNLSTISAPQSDSSLLAIEADAYSATMIAAQANDFLRLLWEASIVNAPGYYLYYNNGASEGESGLPEDIFGGQSNQANLTLVVTFGSLNDSCDTLLIDTGDFVEGELFAEAADALVWHPAIAPGAVAFELTRPNPEHPDFTGASTTVALEPLFNLLSYYVVGDASFSESIHGLPVGPTGDDPNEDAPLNWTYRQGIKVHPYAANGGDNLYAGTGDTITLGFEFLDIFGNVMEVTTTPELEAPVLYSDRIKGVGQWPGVTTGYLFEPDGGNGKLTTTVSFAASIYTDAAVDEQRVVSALEAYRQINEQLNGPGVTAAMQTSVAPNKSVDAKSVLTSFVNDVIAYLEAPASDPAPIGTSLTMASIGLGDRNAQADNTFAVSVTIEVERESARVDPEALTNMPEAQRAVSSVAPESTSGMVPLPDNPAEIPGDSGQKMAFHAFAVNFESAFPEFKVATGMGESGPQTIWAVRLVDVVAEGGVGITVSIDNNPAFFAPAPLSNTLEQRADVPVRLLGPNGATSLESFANVDMDLWGREFLTVVDRFLTPDLAVAGRQVNPTAYKDIVDGKKTLAGGIAKGVTNVLSTAPGGDGFLEAAQEAYEQSLLTRLSTAYETQTAVVYPVTTNNTDLAAGTIPPRLYGNVSEPPPDPEAEDTDNNPDYSLSTAKIDLNVGSGPKFAFLFSAERTADQASVKLDIRYNVTHVEHDISPALAGYEASSWLTLVLPDEPIVIGEVDIPIALREYPVPPALIGQNAIPQDLESATTLESATLWQYLYTYEQQTVAQDNIFANVKFNVGPEVSSQLLQAPALDLFDWLARFHREYPELKPELDLLVNGKTDLDAAGQTTVASDAVAWLADLVKGVAGTWETWVVNAALTRQLLQDALDEYEWDFEVTERRFGNEVRIEMVLPAGSNQGARFPDVEVLLEDGETRSVLSALIADGVASYTYPWTAAELPDTRQRTYIFTDLDVLNTENAWGGIHLERNLNLSSSAENPPTTNPRFVYQTPEVRFVNKVTPLIDNKQPINISPDGNTKDLAGHLTDLLAGLFETASDDDTRDRLMKVGCRYAYDVRGQAGPAEGPEQLDEFQAYMPILQRMAFDIKPNATGDFVNGIVASINEWMVSANPSRARGFYEFDITVFAALSNTDLPVMRLRRLWLGLDRIS